MKKLYVTTLIALITATSVGHAGSIDDAEAGTAAFERGDYATAERLFTQALGTGGLTPSDRESALVMRARAYIGESRDDLALKDIERALKLDPNDQEAVNLKRQVEGDKNKVTNKLAPKAHSERSENLIYLTCNYTDFTTVRGDRQHCDITNKYKIDLNTGDVTRLLGGRLMTPHPHLDTIAPNRITWMLPEEAPFQVIISRDSWAISSWDREKNMDIAPHPTPSGSVNDAEAESVEICRA
jgi:tetratricopeptide (TPR) repeat protein